MTTPVQYTPAKTPMGHWFAMRSIKTKLVSIIMLISCTGIILAGCSLVVYEWYNFRKTMVVDLTALTAVIADNSLPAILFDDGVDAKVVLNSLASKPPIASAFIYGKNDTLLATYKRQSLADNLTFNKHQLLGKKAVLFTDNLLVSKQTIYVDDQQLGVIYLSEDYSELQHMLQQLVLTLLAILVLLATLAYFLATFMQRFISQPLINLATLAQQISGQQNYALRAVKQSDDELGDLTDDFNAMLHQVEKRDKALRCSEKRFEALIEQAADALYLCDPHGKILLVNQSACLHLGYAKSELYNLSFDQIDRDFHQSGGTHHLWLQLDSAGSRTSNCQFRRKDGSTFPIELHSGLLALEDRECVLSFARDITRRKRTEAALQKANDQLESKVTARTHQLRESNEQLRKAKEKAENASLVKSEFLANMSHEIRTPMNSVMGFTDLLGDSDLNAKQRSYLESIQSGAKGLMTIINDVLDLSKIEAGKLNLEFEAVDIHALVHDVKQIFSQPIIDKGLLFEVDINPQLPRSLILDQTRIRQILFNLIGNALKFTAQGFIRIAVDLQPTLAQKDEQKGNNEQPDHSTVNLSFVVSDSGIGIKDDQIEHIFGQFTQQEGQSARQYGGTGLGLAICTNLAKMMGGRITVTSETGNGSVFTLTLDGIAIASTLSPPELKPADSDDTVIFIAAKVLLVDDVVANRLLIKEQFDDCGITFGEADNGKQAIEMAKSFAPDLIIMDMRMPVMNGVEANKQLKLDRQTRDIPVIALTASVTNSGLNRQGSDHFVAYLHKPSTKQAIAAVFRQFLNILPKTTSAPQTSQQPTQEVEVNLSESQRKMLLTRLNMQTRRLYRNASSSGLINDIKRLADDLEQIGRDFDSQKILVYSEDLDHAADMFDIEKMEKQLAGFEALVNYFEISQA